MRKILLFLLLAFFIYPAKAQAQIPNEEAITSFRSQITINQDTSISITEDLDYFTPTSHHGIYRYIPEKYREEGWIRSLPVTDIQVFQGKNLEKAPFEIIREEGNVTIKIGDPAVTFTGERNYRISYKIAKTIKRQQGFDELYWDITGEGFKIPVLESSVKISTPFAEILEAKCFTGPVGSTETNCTSKWLHNEAEIVNIGEVDYGRNFTVAIKLNQNNSLIFPSELESKWDKIKNNLVFLLIPLPVLIMFIYWYKKGRDYRFDSPNVFDLDPDKPKRLRPLFESIHTPLVYEPFKEMTPGEAGTILDERVDNQDIISEIIDLARKKYLKVERIEEKGFFKTGYDYLFTKLKEPTSLVGHQKYLMVNIFAEDKVVKLSKLKGTFYVHMAKVKEMINDSLTERKMFTSKPIAAIGKGVALAVTLDVLVFMSTISQISFLESAWPVALMFASFITTLIFALNMTQKTAVGTNLSLQAKGLRETIRLGKWREEIKEKHLFIEEVLPYAIALGVIGKLTKDMAALNIEPPKYFGGGFGTNTMAWSGFVNDFSQSAASGLSYNPSSSSSGGSGFSGGSSGGGGGGGGGGSW